MQYTNKFSSFNMNKQLLLAILLLFGNYCTKAEVQELAPLNHKLNTSYLPAVKDQHHLKSELNWPGRTTKSNSNYRHNKPKVIDDPLPVKVDCIKPLDIDIKTDKREAIFKGAVLTGLAFNVYKKPLFTENPTHESPASHVIVDKDIHHNDNSKRNATAKFLFKPSDHNIKAESSIESRTYVQTPAEVSVVPINVFAGPATNFKLLNSADDIELGGSAPVVIFQAGDDIAFLKDTSVIDDYEHTFTEEEENNKSKKSTSKKETTKTPTKTTTKPFSQKDFHKNYNDHTSTAAASNNFYAKTSVDSHASAATHHLVIHDETSETTHSEHGYIYDKPKIPFTS